MGYFLGINLFLLFLVLNLLETRGVTLFLHKPHQTGHSESNHISPVFALFFVFYQIENDIIVFFPAGVLVAPGCLNKSLQRSGFCHVEPESNSHST